MAEVADLMVGPCRRAVGAIAPDSALGRWCCGELFLVRNESVDSRVNSRVNNLVNGRANSGGWTCGGAPSPPPLPGLPPPPPPPIPPSPPPPSLPRLVISGEVYANSDLMASDGL